MKKQKIYSYLQRSLLKVLTKSDKFSNYGVFLTKPLTAKVNSLNDNRNLDELVLFLTQINVHSKQIKPFITIQNKEKLVFKCQFFLKSDLRSTPILRIYNANSLTFFNFFFNLQGNFAKLKQRFNGSQLIAFFSNPDKQSLLFFRSSFYKKRKNYTNSLKSFENLYSFFNIFSLSINTRISFFNYTEFSTEVSLILQVLSITCVNYSFPWLVFINNTKNYKSFLEFMGTKKSIFKEKSFFFQLFFFLLTIFSLISKYIKQKNEKLYKQRDLKFSFFQFHETEKKRILFLWFRPFFWKIITPKTVNFTPVFLMRPLFSVTRLDTFFICESLKLPIYPDKSNLRVDFLRNRVRKQVLPTIRILLNPQFDTLLCKLTK